MKSLARLSLGLFLVLPISSCGTLFFQQRPNKPHSDKLDANIMILDGIGLIFWIVPGLVAYIVDFSTGAIYLPNGVEKGEGPFIKDEPAAKKEEPAKSN
jgi:hypothetical protein